MAVGDKAAAAGLQVFPSTQNVNQGYINDNQRGDELADEINTRKRQITVSASQPSGTGHVIGDIWIKSAT